MVTATIDDFKVKQDEMLRQAKNFRLIRNAQKLNSPAPGPFRAIKNALSQLLSF